MVLHETEQQLQSVLDGTVLAACRQTLALLYQTELAVEGSINVILDKSETIHVKINNCEVKSKEDLDEKKIEKIKVTSPPKRRRGRPPKSQSKTKVNLIEEKVKKTEPLPSCSNEEIGEAAVSDRGTPVKKEPSEKAAIPQAAKSDPQSFKDMVVNSSLSELQHLATQLAHHVPPDDVQDTDADDRKKDEGASNISGDKNSVWHPRGTVAGSDGKHRKHRKVHRNHRGEIKAKWINVSEGNKFASCDTCGKQVVKRNMSVHKKLHTGDRPFKCSYCAKGFKAKANMIDHERIHTGERPYRCEECGKTFTVVSNLKVHQRVHTGEKPFQCSFCGFKTARKDAIELHERTHTGEKPFQCRYCGTRFSDKSHIKPHERIHTGEKRFKCTYCEKRFIIKSSCMIHERTHTGEKPYTCEYCGKCFADRRNLIPHVRTHTGEKPHRCLLCGIGFDRKRRLTAHMNDHISGVITDAVVEQLPITDVEVVTSVPTGENQHRTSIATSTSCTHQGAPPTTCIQQGAPPTTCIQHGAPPTTCIQQGAPPTSCLHQVAPSPAIASMNQQTVAPATAPVEHLILSPQPSATPLHQVHQSMPVVQAGQLQLTQLQPVQPVTLAQNQEGNLINIQTVGHLSEGIMVLESQVSSQCS